MQFVALQRSAGNRAVTLAIQRQAGCTSCCQECAEEPAAPTGSRAPAPEEADRLLPAAGRKAVQRDATKPAAPVDVAFFCETGTSEGDELQKLEASSLGNDEAAPSAKSLAKSIANHSPSIANLFIVSHGSFDKASQRAAVFFNGSQETLKNLAFEIDEAIKARPDKGTGFVPPTSVQFRGCRVGLDPAGMQEVLKALRTKEKAPQPGSEGVAGTDRASATNCYTYLKQLGPVQAKDSTGASVDVTDQTQLDNDAKLKASFPGAFSASMSSMKEGACLLGAKGTSGAARTTKLQEVYFHNKGKLVAKWAANQAENDQNHSRPFTAGDKCFEDLTAGTVGCIKVQVPESGPLPAVPPQPKGECKLPGTTTALLDQADATVVRLDGEGAVDPDDPGVAALVGLRRGDGLNFATTGRRPRVSDLQGRLAEHGQHLSADGMWGAQTSKMLHAVQATAGLPQTEEVDQPTAAALTSRHPGETRSDIIGLAKGDGLTFGTAKSKPAVGRLQELLTGHCAECKPDGMFGPETQGALDGFRTRHGLEHPPAVDGITADILEGRIDPPSKPDQTILV